MKNHEEFLKQFMKIDANHQNIIQILYNDNYYIGAHDNHFACFIKTDKLSEYKLLSYVSDRLKELHTIPIVTITLSDIYKIENSVPLIDEIIEKENDCEECNGTGEVYCNHCENTNDCNNCNGMGTITIKENTGNKIPNTKSLIQISDKHFRFDNIMKLKKVLEYFDRKHINYCKEYSTISFFEDENADFFVLIADYLQSETNKPFYKISNG